MMQTTSTMLPLLLQLALVALVSARPMLYEPSAADPLLPKGFEILPAESIERLRLYHFDRRLTPDARRDRIESVFDDLPAALLEQLPLAPGLARLPELYQAPFRALQVDRTISWRERAAKTRALITLLPYELQRVVEPQQPSTPPPSQSTSSGAAAASELPSRPPPGFETALSPTLYAQLLRVHADASLSDAEKKMRLNAIMRMAPREQLEQLPLPAGFGSLSQESLARARTILHDFTLDWDQRAFALQRFIASLPADEQRALLASAAAVQQPAPAATFIQQLPSPQREALAATLQDRSGSQAEMFAKVETILDSLPAQVRARVPPPPPVFPFWAPRVV